VERPQQPQEIGISRETAFLGEVAFAIAQYIKDKTAASSPRGINLKALYVKPKPNWIEKDPDLKEKLEIWLINK